jgi:hypothetical protein
VDLLHHHRQRKGLHTEEVVLDIPMAVNLEVSLTHHHEDHRLSNGFQVEVMKLNPVVMWERSHEVAHRHLEPMFMERQEADDVAHGQNWLLLVPGHETFGARSNGGGAE